MYAVSNDPPPSRKTFFSIAGSWFLLIYSIIVTGVITFVTTAKTFFEKLTENIFGWVGKTLISLFLLSLLSVVIYDVQNRAFETANNAYCVTADTRHTINDGVDVFAPYIGPFICLNNLVFSLVSSFITSTVSIIWDCADWKQIGEDLLSFVGTVLEAVLTFFFTGDSVFGNRLDIASMILALQTLISNLQTPFDCLCLDLGDTFFFILTVLTNDKIACWLDYWINAEFAIYQQIYSAVKGLLSGENTVPNLLWIPDVCSGSICAGMWIDDTITLFFSIFLLDPPNLAIGCTLANLYCVFWDGFGIILNTIIQLIWTVGLFGDEWNFFVDTDVSPLIGHIDDLGKCVQTFFTIFDPCLGEATGNVIRFIGDFLRYLVKITQEGEQDFSIIKDSLDRFVGQATYGGGSHVANTAGHAVVYNQTSLTCLVSNILQWIPSSSCNIAVGDLVNSVAQLLLTPFAVLNDILENLDLLEDIDGNPLADDATKADFEEFFTTILNSIVDRIFGVLDYTAHLLGCTPILQGFGNMLILTVQNLRLIWTEIVDLVVLLVELIFQTVITLLTLFTGGEIFPGREFDDEIGTFFLIVVDVLIQLAELFVTLLETAINFTIGFFFPALFGQDTLYEDPDAEATLTACITEPGDCICGLAKSLFTLMCIPEIVCLNDLLPGCGKFQKTPTTDGIVTTITGRKRSTTDNVTYFADVYDNPFDYYAGEFPHGRCGRVFAETRKYSAVWRNNNGQFPVGERIPDTQLIAFVTCARQVKLSMEYNEQQNFTVGPHYLLQDDRLHNSTVESMRGLGSMFVMGASNTAAHFNTPEYIINRPTGAKPRIISFQEQLKRHNITDNIAVQYVGSVLKILTTGYTRGSNYVREKRTQGTQFGRFADVADSFAKLSTASWATAKIIGNEFSGSGFNEALADTVTQWATVITTGAWKEYIPENRRRHHDEAPKSQWFPSMNRTTEKNKDPENYEITYADMVFWRSYNAWLAFRAWGGLLFGPYLEMVARRNINAVQFEGLGIMRHGNPDMEIQGPYDTIAPYRISDKGYYGFGRISKRNMWADINRVQPDAAHPYLDIDEDEVHTGLSYLHGMEGRVHFVDHVPNSCGSVLTYCDDPVNASGCYATEYFQTLGLCQNFLGIFGIVMWCNETVQAMAIYRNDSCIGDPIRIAIAAPEDPLDCVRFRVAPPGLENDYFCVRYDQCTACPVRQVIPNFQCRIVDETFHRIEYMAQRCLVQFIGAIYPPFNFSVIIPDVFNPTLSEPTSTVSLPAPPVTPQPGKCKAICGDGIVELFEKDANGNRCETCDHRNRRDGDGCSAHCQLEPCWQVPDQRLCAPWNVADPAYNCDIKAGGPYSTIQHFSCPTRPMLEAQQWPLQCLQLAKFPSFPFSLQAPGNFDDIYGSRKVLTMGHDVAIYEYDSLDCSGNMLDVRIVTENQCGNASGYCHRKADVPGRGLECMLDYIPLRTDRRDCRICGDNNKFGPEECDPKDSWVNPNCSYCAKVMWYGACPAGKQCLGFCRPTRGFIYMDQEFGMVAKHVCFSSPTTSIGCPFASECMWIDVNFATRKREVNEKWSRLVWAIEQYRANLVEEDEDDAAELAAYEADLNRHAEANHQQGKREVAHLAAVIIPKDPFIVNEIYRLANDIIAFFKGTSDIATEWSDWLYTFVTNTEVNKYTPEEERGLLWYVVFPFWCQLPISFTCEIGLGLADGTVLFIYIFFAGLVLASLLLTSLSSLWVSLFSMIGMSVFLGVTFGYPWPGCMLFSTNLRLPECLATEVQDVLHIFNGTCIGFLDPEFALSPCTDACDQQLIDCRDIGFIDGFDTAVAFVEVFLPTDAAVWMRTSSTAAGYKSALSLISMLSGWDLIGSYDIALQNFDLQGADGTYPQKVCIITTSLSVFQIGLFVVGIYALAGPLYALFVPLISWLGVMLYALANWIDQNFIPDANPNDDRLAALETYQLNHPKAQ